MRVLVTGAGGFLGANLCKRLQADGHDVVGATLNRKGHTSLDALGVDVRLEYGDIQDGAFVERLVNAYEVGWVFHLAGVSIVRVAAQNPARATITNILGTVNVLEACRRAGHVQAVVVASSDKAYGDWGGVAYTEDMPLKPSGAYEVSKACADMITRCYGQHHGLRAMVARCANLYGPGDLHWSRLIPGSCKRAIGGQAPIVHPSAWDYQREWLHVNDAVDAYILLAKRGEAGEAYNVGSGQIVSVGQVAGMVAKALCAPMPERGRRVMPYEIPAQRLDRSKLTEWRWFAGVKLLDGIENTAQWYRDFLRRGHA